MSDAQKLVNTMKKILLATVAIVAFSAPSFAAEKAKTVGQAPPSFYLAQDTATMKCQIVETQPVAGGSMKVVGAAQAHVEGAARPCLSRPMTLRAGADRSSRVR